MVGDLVREVDVVAGVFDGNPADGLVAAAVGGEPVQAAGRQQDGPPRAQSLLMAEQPLIVSAAVVGVLMQVDDLLFGFAAKRPAGQGGGGGCRGGGGQKVTAGQRFHVRELAGARLVFPLGQGDFFLGVVKSDRAAYASQALSGPGHGQTSAHR